MGFYGGQLTPHSHTTAAGDGGQTTSQPMLGVPTIAGSPAGSTDAATVSYAQSNVLLWN